MSEKQSPFPLYYFKGHGLAERVRWVLAAADVPFENVPVSTREHFLELCESGIAPLKQMPILRAEGKLLVQTPAMIEWVGRRAGLAGDSPDEQFAVRAFVELSRDFCGVGIGYPFADDERRRALRDSVLPAQVAKFMPTFERAIRANASDRSIFADPAATHAEVAAADPAAEEPAAEANPHLVGRSLTVADVCFAQACNVVALVLQDDKEYNFLSLYPFARATVLRTLQHPPLQAYLQSERRYPMPDSVYAREVDVVLGRA